MLAGTKVWESVPSVRQDHACAPAPIPLEARLTDARDREITRLRRRLREAQAALREAKVELADPPAADAADSEAEPPLSAAEIRHLHDQFAPPTGNACAACGVIHPGPCGTCGGLHARSCPRVRSVEYTSQGDNILIRKVEYWPDGRWSVEGIFWPEQLPPLPGEDQGATPSE